MNYTSASDINLLHELYSQPPAIVAACNRVVQQSNHIIRRQHDRGWIRGWWRGLFWGVAISAVVAGFAWMTGCQAAPPEIPFDVGKSHCIIRMSSEQIRQAMAWKRWKHQPMDALYDPNHKPGFGESGFNEKDKPGRLYCPRGMSLSWDLDSVGRLAGHEDANWIAHCYLNLKQS